MAEGYEGTKVSSTLELELLHAKCAGCSVAFAEHGAAPPHGREGCLAFKPMRSNVHALVRLWDERRERRLRT